MGDSHWVSQATGCLFAHSPARTSRQSLFFLGSRRRPLGTRDEITVATRHTSNTHDSTLPARRDRIGYGVVWESVLLASQFRSRFSGYLGWLASICSGRKCGRKLQAGLDGRMRIISPRADLHPIVSHETCSGSEPGDGDGMQARRSRLDLRQWLVLRGVKEQRSGSYQRHAYVVRSSRHEMLESIPPWMAAGLLTTCKHAHLVVC